MATRFLSRSLSLSLLAAKHSLSLSLSLSHSSTILRLRPLAAFAAHLHSLTPAGPTIRCFSTRQTSSSLNDPNPNWSNRPPKETILLDGCDFEHWLVVVEPPQGDVTRDEIISSYIKTLAQVVGSEEEARMKIYSVSTRHYFAFGALVSEELSYKLKELPGVRWVLPDSYLDVRAKDYGGEPFINGEAVPYDPKYHAEWVKNNARANERNRRNDRPRNFDRSRNFERRENMQNQNRGGPNQGVSNPQPMPPSNTGQMPPNNMGPVPPNMRNMPPDNMRPTPPNMQMPPNNREGMPFNNMGPNNMGPSNMGPNNIMQHSMGRVPQNNGYAANNTGGAPNGAQNYQYSGGLSYQSPQYDNRDMRGPPPPPQQNRDFLRNYEPAPVRNNPYQSQNVQARDMPNPPTY